VIGGTARLIGRRDPRRRERARQVGERNQERTVNIFDSSHIPAATRRTIAKGMAAAVAVAALAGCGGGGGTTASAPAPASPPDSRSSIMISNFKFSPATETVRRGARIEVSNSDTAPHTVTADDGSSFDSGTLQPGGSTTINVARTGRFPYHCTIHPFMKGVLVVK
jgi:plastocyanin